MSCVHGNRWIRDKMLWIHFHHSSPSQSLTQCTCWLKDFFWHDWLGWWANSLAMLFSISKETHVSTAPFLIIFFLQFSMNISIYLLCTNLLNYILFLVCGLYMHHDKYKVHNFHLERLGQMFIWSPKSHCFEKFITMNSCFSVCFLLHI